MKLYLDADLSPRIAAALEARGVDAVSAHDAGMARASDPEQLAFAAREARCLVTADVRHFRALAVEAVREQRPHAGIILSSPRFRGAIGAIVSALARVAERYPEGLGEYDVVYLTREREP
ncbi:MAG: hypothetical protein A3F92_05760 [Candidatus Rokubacteria bacterium RIFCSPLOWO2_12_FULL_71_22]|nr:MAG: hypothetical protein A3F92_05760 [Candidatus Rokubacteria bacterium RIFCSPLOWO2_12_FULL_71_22]